MLAIEEVSLGGADEELTAVGVLASVGHGEDAWASVLEGEVLVSELLAIDRSATSAVASSEVTTLAHEVWNDSVELGANESAANLGLNAKSSEVLSSLRDDVRSKSHLNSTSGGSADGDVEIDDGGLAFRLRSRHV